MNTLTNKYFRILPLETVPGATLIAYAWEGRVHLYSFFMSTDETSDTAFVAATVLSPPNPKKVIEHELSHIGEESIASFVKLAEQAKTGPIKPVPFDMYAKQFKLDDGEVLTFHDHAQGFIIELITSNVDGAFQLSKFRPDAGIDNYTESVAEAHLNQFLYKAAAQMFIEKLKKDPRAAILLPQRGADADPEYLTVERFEGATLEWLQSKVEGFIEPVQMPNEFNLVMIVNEEGAYTHERNPLAEAVHGILTGQIGAELYGPALIGTDGILLN